MSTLIEQQTFRRLCQHGLTAIDPEKVCPGYVLYNPLFEGGPIYLIDKNGKIIHQWSLPYAPLYGYLLPNGNLFYMGKVRDDPAWQLDFPNWQGFKCGILQEVDWAGRVIWEHRSPYQHHDARRTEAGGAIYTVLEQVPREISERVQGGRSTPRCQPMWADSLIEVDKAGQIIWQWHAYEHLDFDTNPLPPNGPRHDWTHANTIVPLANKQVLVCFKNISRVGIINQQSNCWQWQIGNEILGQPHDPNLLENGNILIFDNGVFRKNELYPFSRVLEIDPTTNEIIWTYQEPLSYTFFSQYLSGARRLANGNTLITDGPIGRIFQVTAAQEVVWEYINPIYSPNHHGVPANSIFRSTFYGEGEISGL